MDVLIRPTKLKGIIDCVPSKSYSHRAIIAASLAKGRSVVSNLIFSQDILATIDSCRAFGANIEILDKSIIVNGVSRVERKQSSLNARESGSTIRFMIPIMMTCDSEFTFTGENHLVKRPLTTYTNIFDKQDIKYTQGEDHLPLTVHSGLSAGIYEVEGNISSQFITGLLYALPLLNGESIIKVTTPLESKGYVDLTIDILNKYGVEVINDNYENFFIRGNQEFKPYDYEVEGDYSQCAFFLVAGALGNDIKINCMNQNSLQGDKKIEQDVAAFNALVTRENGSLYAQNKENKACKIDFSQSPDLGPILSVLASLSKGTSVFEQVQRLRIKECDRVTCMRLELEKMGVIISENPETMVITGQKVLNGNVELECHNDHRIAMALAIASTCTNGTILLRGADCVKKSYPHFFDDFKKLGGDFDVFN